MNILVTTSASYLYPLRVMLYSLFQHETTPMTIYLMYAEIPAEELQALDQFITEQGHRLTAIQVDGHLFDAAPSHMHYSKEMYYRLLAFKVLPETVDRVLYLDPDMLILQPIKPLYELDLGKHYFAAASHERFGVNLINRLRFIGCEFDTYYNTGVLLMDLEPIRREMTVERIFNVVESHAHALLLPDQDIFNALYNPHVYQLDEKVYNYDVRHATYYQLITGGEWTQDHALQTTVCLHYCGKHKPWHADYRGNYQAVYQYYEQGANAVISLNE